MGNVTSVVAVKCTSQINSLKYRRREDVQSIYLGDMSRARISGIGVGILDAIGCDTKNCSLFLGSESAALFCTPGRCKAMMQIS